MRIILTDTINKIEVKNIVDTLQKVLRSQVSFLVKLSVSERSVNPILPAFIIF
jgi:hypothetical protein